jgi:hypothetical protein
MWVEILRSVMISGESVTVGSRLEIEPTIGKMLINMNKAQASTAPEPVVEAAKRSRKAPEIPDITEE